jgi:hypothetical protein
VPYRQWGGAHPSTWRDVRTYILVNGYEFWIALAAALAGLTYLLYPDVVKQSAVGVQLKSLLPWWEAMYLAGGVMIVVGMIACRYIWGFRLEVAGLCLLTAAILTNGAAVVTFRTVIGVSTSLTFIGLALAGIGRIRLLIRVTGAWGGRR